MDESCEVDDATVVSGSDAAEMFEAPEASLDLVTMSVDGGVVGDEDFAVPL